LPRAGPVERLTNSKRFALGLPPLKPKAHRRAGPGIGGTHVQAAARALTSQVPPVTAQCNILATDSNGNVIGFISPSWNGFGEYGTFQGSSAGALVLSFSYIPGSSSNLDCTAVNSPSGAYPFFGAIDGFGSDTDDLAPGNPNYVYIGGTTQTPAGSTPASGGNSFAAATGYDESVESAIWSYDPVSQAITANWVNTDGSTVPTTIIYADGDENALALTCDYGAFSSVYGAFPAVTFACVPA